MWEDRIDDATDDASDVPGTLRYGIMSYGSDMPVDAIVDRMERGDIFVPLFQRKYVWTAVQASRFVESLLLGLPVPGIFLFREPDTRKHMVVDGQQRLRTLQCYHHGAFPDGRQFRLSGVSKAYSGQAYRDLADSDRRELDDSLIHATIFQQIEPDDDRSSIYDVFERLNTGGTPLQPQEIRACIYRGKLNDLLSELAANPFWRQLYLSQNSRKKDEEIILRFLALLYRAEQYERPMKQFLNRFMEENRNPTDSRREDFRQVFAKTVREVAEVLGAGALRPEKSLNVAVADATLVGLAHRLDRGPIVDKEQLKLAHQRLLSVFEHEQLYRTGTTDKGKLERRLELARAEYEAVR